MKLINFAYKVFNRNMYKYFFVFYPLIFLTMIDNLFILFIVSSNYLLLVTNSKLQQYFWRKNKKSLVLNSELDKKKLYLKYIKFDDFFKKNIFVSVLFYFSFCNFQMVSIILFKIPFSMSYVHIFVFLLSFLSLLFILTKVYIFKKLKKISKKFLKNHKSEIIVFFSGLEGTEYQLEQWKATFSELNKIYRTTLIIYNRRFNKYAANYSIPSVYLSRTGNLHDFLLKNVDGEGNLTTKIILYMNNSSNNSSALVLRQFRHIHLNHGDSDKAANALNTSRDYDDLFVSGNAAIDRYKKAGWDTKRLHTIGRTQILDLYKLNNNYKKNKRQKKVILYAPTFEGCRRTDCYSSVYRMGYKIVKDIIDSNGFILHFKAHPYTGYYSQHFKDELIKIHNYIDMNRDKGHKWIDQSRPIYNEFVVSDLLIGDISSVCIDYFSLKKPIIATNPFNIDSKSEKIIEAVPFWKGANVLGYENGNFNIIKLIYESLENLNENYEETAEYYLGGNAFYPENLVSHFIDEVSSLYNSNKDFNESYIPLDNIRFSHG